MNELDELGKRANEAAEWFLRLKDDQVSDHDLSQWLEWCAVPENLREFQRLRQTWSGFEQVGPAAAEMLETLLDTPRPAGAPERVAGFGKGWVAASAVAAMALVAAGYIYFVRTTTVPAEARMLAGPPTIQSSMLPDGSTLTLAPNTQVDVDFGTGHRDLELSNGEAYFKVHPDKTKPFTVKASGVRVTAVGTAFDVRARADRVVVTVQEGIVEVAREDGAGDDAGRWRVNAGYQISYNVSTRAARIASVDAGRALSWREGRLEYFSEPLEAVAADVSRYSSRPIEISDSRIARLTFTGTVFTGSIDDWLAAVQETFPVRVVVGDDQRIVLVSTER
ncbi:FecR family protein [Steroidobacter sp.]|uniref:FecR family protein n=1 Tax=Steroidobacter sp. TaxID=1978227 RepID=UPI001A636547|nr:FecR domain-containing protein [Steroidobacter sp.]MBL8269826.1 FecR domain-containing protein [Steroidobacter sp.]